MLALSPRFFTIDKEVVVVDLAAIVSILTTQGPAVVLSQDNQVERPRKKGGL